MDYLLCCTEPDNTNIETVFYSTRELLSLLSNWFDTKFDSIDAAIDRFEFANPTDYYFISVIIIDWHTADKHQMGYYL